MRKILLSAAAAATLIAAWFAPDTEPGVVSPAAARTESASHMVRPASTASLRAETGASAEALRASLHIAARNEGEGEEEEELGNLFAKQRWSPQVTGKQLAQAAAAAAAAAQPVVSQAPSDAAPALPFQFMGRYSDDGQTAYFLQMDGQNLLARPGQRVTDHYLLEAVDDEHMIFIYLPLNQKQILAVGDTH